MIKNFMNPVTKQCEKCNKSFDILADDIPFYEKMDLPMPTMCPECRFKYLLAFWVNGKFRITKSALSGKTIITVLSESVLFPIYDRSEFVSDAWEPLSYGKDYDASYPFIDQLVELQSKVPHPHQVGAKNTNCDWADDVWESKDQYLTRSVGWSESNIYGYRLVRCKNSVDLTFCFDLERSFDCLYCFKSYNLKYSFNSRDCMDSLFLYDCRNCQNCFMCWNLRNQKYCILNQQYSKEEYENKLKEYNLKSRKVVDELKREFWQHIGQDAVHRQDYNSKTANSSGNFLENDKNCYRSYFLQESENCRHIFRGFGNKETIDSVGAFQCEKCVLGAMDQFGAYGNICNLYTTSCRYSVYLDNCEECEYCFGCVGMRKKKYCILNKQYSKEGYESLVEKIKADMNSRGEWGKFWPLSSAYCGYNLSLANMMFPMTKEEAIKFGTKWDESIEQHYESIVSANDLPDSIEQVQDDITKQRILCPETKLSYNITKDELAFYKEHGIPLPRRHFDWRTLDRFKPFSHMITLQKGNCCFCKKDIEHYYSPELGFEKIACLECYQSKIA
ncbi:MAG: hypothetical protein A2312_02370 [Candidatus Staskawiczbacteria bacterium RIFOXYB2_FULL_32_9]|uniref:Uncharacterized protein n=1 Tax=Candidatus Staskawiczbacteria bacterium RIFOXYD1_FULL_32_13 TaxID=1802234 RepID=A0A1G2JMI7_9BACT|nr:MAG: hypothetical protein UR22_C0004G0049 [Parcubacteria group bacterium GW2011_GWC2_32_10]OGZ78242.1 MAG: hypothetical protein A2256_02985 [Candidatus Staskawiczbacteria bacterium RIFOXYA2_FULL_32_7]OGZ79324.1 MAG: hypothetical protein A2360_01375 [Candidatus Staskawiczbacteria bacterium RIFOXYB1_FULL_32_11]OGZ80973.1 MAG: hypothetical protein A2312_02370 [Candidatus Staskawiczbacteria bacterium RIFOXYB2_FULL_32_9]OGZ88066.1 MAG: hypothetical protein A2463_00460 [Candidatus Staskawiczbacter